MSSATRPDPPGPTGRDTAASPCGLAIRIGRAVIAIIVNAIALAVHAAIADGGLRGGVRAVMSIAGKGVRDGGAGIRPFIAAVRTVALVAVVVVVIALGVARIGQWPMGSSGVGRPSLRGLGRVVRRLAVSRSARGLVDVLVDGAVGRLPECERERWAEEWAEHRTHRRGLGLLWWALCLRVTAFRMAAELREEARLPRPDR